MPQLDMATYPSQLFWLAVCFGLLYLLLARLALPRIATALEERRDRIADELDQAAQLRRQGEAAQAEYEAMLADSREKAQAIAQEARHRLQQEAEAHRQRLEAELREKSARAEEEIEAARRQAGQDLQALAAELAGLMLQRLAGAGAPRERLQATVAAALEERQG